MAASKPPNIPESQEYKDFVTSTLRHVQRGLKMDHTAKKQAIASAMEDAADPGNALDVEDRVLRGRFALGADDATYLNAGLSTLWSTAAGSVDSNKELALAPKGLYAPDAVDGIRSGLIRAIRDRAKTLKDDAPEQLRVLSAALKTLLSLQQIRDALDVTGKPTAGMTVDRMKVLLETGWQGSDQDKREYLTLIETMHSVINDMEGRNIASEIVEEVKKQLDTIERQKQRFRVEKRSLERQLDSVKKTLKDRKERIERLKLEHLEKEKELKGQIATLQGEKLQLKKTNNNLVIQHNAALRRVRERELTIQGLNDQLRAITSELETKQGEINDLDARMKLVTKTKNEQEALAGHRGETIKEQNTKLSEGLALVGHLTRQRDALKEEVKAAETQRNAYETQLGAAQTDLEKSNAALQKSEADTQILQNELEAVKAKLSDQIATNENRRDQTERQEELLAVFRDEYQGLAQDYHDLDATYNAAEKANAVDVAKLKAELETLKRELTEMDRQMEAIRTVDSLGTLIEEVGDLEDDSNGGASQWEAVVEGVIEEQGQEAVRQGLVNACYRDVLIERNSEFQMYTIQNLFQAADLVRSADTNDDPVFVQQCETFSAFVIESLRTSQGISQDIERAVPVLCKNIMMYGLFKPPEEDKPAVLYMTVDTKREIVYMPMTTTMTEYVTRDSANATAMGELLQFLYKTPDLELLTGLQSTEADLGSPSSPSSSSSTNAQVATGGTWDETVLGGLFSRYTKASNNNARRQSAIDQALKNAEDVDTSKPNTQRQSSFWKIAEPSLEFRVQMMTFSYTRFPMFAAAMKIHTDLAVMAQTNNVPQNTSPTWNYRVGGGVGRSNFLTNQPGTVIMSPNLMRGMLLMTLGQTDESIDEVNEIIGRITPKVEITNETTSMVVWNGGQYTTAGALAKDRNATALSVVNAAKVPLIFNQAIASLARRSHTRDTRGQLVAIAGLCNPRWISPEQLSRSISPERPLDSPSPIIVRDGGSLRLQIGPESLRESAPDLVYWRRFEQIVRRGALPAARLAAGYEPFPRT